LQGHRRLFGESGKDWANGTMLALKQALAIFDRRGGSDDKHLEHSIETTEVLKTFTSRIAPP
jgi:hypothetical protein